MEKVLLKKEIAEVLPKCVAGKKNSNFVCQHVFVENGKVYATNGYVALVFKTEGNATNIADGMYSIEKITKGKIFYEVILDKKEDGKKQGIDMLIDRERSYEAIKLAEREKGLYLQEGLFIIPSVKADERTKNISILANTLYKAFGKTVNFDLLQRIPAGKYAIHSCHADNEKTVIPNAILLDDIKDGVSFLVLPLVNNIEIINNAVSETVKETQEAV